MSTKGGQVMAGEESSSEQAVSLTAGEWLHLRRQLVADHTQEILLTKLEEEIAVLAEADPDRAAEILNALTISGLTDDRDIAAIYVGTLLPTRHERAKELLGKLLEDPNEQIHEKAFETLEQAIEENKLTTEEATRLAQTYYTAHPVA